MSLSAKRWVWPQEQTVLALKLAEACDLPLSLARLLIRRGLVAPEEALAFLYPEHKHLHSPWLLLNMERAAGRLVKALREKEKITVYGDYDADGVTAAAIVTEVLSRCGADIDYYLPSRFAGGYGLSKEALKELKAGGTDLVVTVDCGINSVQEIELAAGIGLDLIVTDHHLPLVKMPQETLVINPLQKDCPYPYKELSGAGVAFKLAVALCERLKVEPPFDLLDLAALGTAADVVPLNGENRTIVSLGLEVLRRQKRAGLKALGCLAGLSENKLSSFALSFIFAPALNAAGRMGEADPALKLLLEKDFGQAEILAKELYLLNQKRRETERKILQEAESLAQKQFEEPGAGVIALASESWHRGVIGIVASRLAEKFDRPVALVAFAGESGLGSARSVPGFDITAALSEASGLLERFGGHTQAAGFTVLKNNFEPLRRSLNRYSAPYFAKTRARPPLNLEAELAPADFSLETAESLELLEPFGLGNPAPLLGAKKWELVSFRLVGAGRNHLKLKVKNNHHSLDPIFFSAAKFKDKLQPGVLYDLAFSLKTGFFNGRKTLEVQLKDLKPAGLEAPASLKVVDRRGCLNKDLELQNLLSVCPAPAAVFFSTRAGRQKIEEKLALPADCRLFTPAGLKNRPGFKRPPTSIILFGLPVTTLQLKPLLKGVHQKGEFRVYLLYGKKDQLLASRLLELSLPAAHHFKELVHYLLQEKKQVLSPQDYEITAQKMGIQPFSAFFERVTLVLDEAKVTARLKDKLNLDALLGELPALLETSAAYAQLKKQRRQSEELQKVLLYASAAELASFFSKLQLKTG